MYNVHIEIETAEYVYINNPLEFWICLTFVQAKEQAQSFEFEVVYPGAIVFISKFFLRELLISFGRPPCFTFTFNMQYFLFET